MKDTAFPPTRRERQAEGLLVDDDADWVELMNKVSRGRAVRVRIASNGFDAGMMVRNTARFNRPGRHAPDINARSLPPRPSDAAWKMSASSASAA